MSLNRRDFLRLSGLVASGMALASCRPLYDTVANLADPAVAGLPPDPRAFLLLRRLTYGPKPEELRRLAQLGPQRWLEEQLAFDDLEDNTLRLRLRTFDFLSQDADALVSWDKEELIAGLQEATLLRKIYSRRQLYEMMVEFWSDHFNITVAKGDCWFLKVVDDREVIRAHALGNFRDLLWASAHSPAMLVYLDNQANHREAPNENYARELLELHTMGVNGGYTQLDVMELSRCLTGWTVKDHFWRGQFIFRPEMHDPGSKTVLKTRIEPAGQAEAERVLDLLALHPSTARHLAVKLVQRFVREVRDPYRDPLVADTTEVFLNTRGDIQATLRSVLQGGWLNAPSPPGPLYKRPLDFVTSALRTLQARTRGGMPVHRYLRRMGQPLHEWPTPDGPALGAAVWKGNLMPRWQFALALLLEEIEGTKIDLSALLHPLETSPPEQILSRFYHLTLGGLPGTSTRRALLDSIGEGPSLSPRDLAGVLGAGLIASPAFQWR